MHDDSSRWIAPGDPHATSQALVAQFRDIYGHDPAGVYFAPGRANLNGEHIDFHGGRCLPMALRHGTYVAASARTDGALRLRTLDSAFDTGVVRIERAAAVPSPSASPSWTTYVSGVLWALSELGLDHPRLRLTEDFGADLLICSTLPIGGGLSSSASLECAAALAYTALATELGAAHSGDGITTALTDKHRAMLAEACIRAEVEAVGAGTGGLDQNTSMRAQAGTLVSLDCRDFGIEHLDLSQLLEDYCFVAVDTGQPHELADGQFADRRVEAEAALAVLRQEQPDLQRLRDALPENPGERDVDLVLTSFDAAVSQAAGRQALGAASADSTSLNPAACRRRLTHALTEMLRSEQLHALFTDLDSESADVDSAAEAVGEILTQGHISMRDNAEVSFPLADQIVQTALDAGALGARLIGGGFGGSVLVLVRRSDRGQITTTTARLSPSIRFLEVVPSGPARVV